MPDYTFTTDADDEAAIVRYRDKHPDQVGLTVQQILRRVIRLWLNHIVNDWREERRQRLKDAYETASPANKAAIDQILGITQLLEDGPSDNAAFNLVWGAKRDEAARESDEKK